MSYLSTSRTRDAANETLLTQNVPSPFTGLLPGSTINGATVQRQQLLRPYPQFLAFGTEEYNGSDRYNAVSFQLEKRFSSGNSFTVQYTHSSLRDKLNYLNPADGILEDRISPNDRPNRLSIGTSLRLPFGQRPALGQGLGQRARRTGRRLAAERHLSIPERVPAGVRQRLLRQRLRSAQPEVEHRREGRWRDRRSRRAGLGHVVLLLPRRARADQRRRRSGEAARRSHAFSSATTSATSRPRCRTCGPTTCTCSTSASTRTLSCPGKCGCRCASK